MASDAIVEIESKEDARPRIIGEMFEMVVAVPIKALGKCIDRVGEEDPEEEEIETMERCLRQINHFLMQIPVGLTSVPILTRLRAMMTRLAERRKIAAEVVRAGGGRIH